MDNPVCLAAGMGTTGDGEKFRVSDLERTGRKGFTVEDLARGRFALAVFWVLATVPLGVFATFPQLPKSSLPFCETVWHPDERSVKTTLLGAV